MPLQIEPIATTTIPLEVELIRPDLVAEQSPEEILRTPIFHGKEKVDFGEFFKVAGSAGDREHCWSGDLSGVHWIGAKMTAGHIRIEGPAGRHVGSEMSGGIINISGDVSDWVGAEMKGGKIEVEGNAGHLVGAAYRGSPRGMTGGTILIQGGAGNEVGHTMRRGLICVGSLGDLAGFNMLAGSILVFGECGIRHGAGMRRGTIGFFGSHRPELLPTFKYACRHDFNILSMTKNLLNGFDYPVSFPTTVDLFHGDFLEGGRGEIMVAAG